MSSTRPEAGARLAASFRDPSGFLFESDGRLYRQINERYRPHYERLVESGLYDSLTREDLLVPHRDAPLESALGPGAFKVIEPERIGFVSYPYEWCFSELKDAALTTLALQEQALDKGMALKDASAYNIQFRHGRPVLIDTLSFEVYEEGKPWVAYRQFCQHFLAPVALMSRVDTRLAELARVHLDGIPLDLASRLLPRSSWLRPSLLTHIHLHAKSQTALADRPSQGRAARVSRTGMAALVDSLRSTISAMEPHSASAHWASYYAEHRYADRSFAHKKDVVTTFVERVGPKRAWDLGANTGLFSRICADRGATTVGFDFDHDTIEASYRHSREKRETNFLPLVLDLTNPSPSIGWAHRERDSLADRGPVDLVLALALVHHLAISNNVPLPDVAAFFARLGEWLIVELVPKEDEQTKRLLASREDIFVDYHRDGFERAFEEAFVIEERVPVEESERTLYLMRRRH